MNIGKILSKEPCNSDLFEGQSHQRLAITIADEIEQDSNCSIIGIDGGWGSGKSNLVGMIEKRLTGKDGSRPELKEKYHFFTYDAWGHQNDLPRRSILEELTSFITIGEAAILNQEDWKIKLENLLAKKKKTSTKTVPSLNFAIVTIALMTALTPVVNAISDNISSYSYKIIFTGSLYLIAIIFVVWKQVLNMKKYGQPINTESFFSELFLLYKDKIKEEEKYETISEREPSTKQFKDWMDSINNDIKGKEKFLIIVIDNMDRLPKLKVQELWAAIHSFFSEKKYSNIRIIVPFDRAHIRNAFESEDIKIEKEEIGHPGEKGDKAIYGDDFINKTFYIVYHVAPPILSGWKQYFTIQWENAFGTNNPVDNTVLQVYDLLTKEHSPRKIVAFINEFVTIKNIADSSIPDKYIALYIFGRATIERNPMTEILAPTYLGALDFMYKEDKEMPAYISSLYYQLPLKDAVDVVYTRQFTKELDDNKPSVLSLMKESGFKKFTAILDRAIADVTNTSNATIALDFLLGTETTHDIQNLWECLYQKDKVGHSAIVKYQPYHALLLSHIQDKSQYADVLIRQYHNNFTEESSIKDYISGIDSLANIESVKLYDRLNNIKTAISPKQFIDLIDEKGELYYRYGFICDDNNLSTYLSSLEVSELKDLNILQFLDNKEYPLASFKDKISEELHNNNLTAENAEILFSRLKEMRGEDPINYRDYISSAKLEILYSNTKTNFRYDLLAMRLSEFNNFVSVHNAFVNVLQIKDTDEISNIAKISNNYFDYGSILAALDRFDNPISRAICKYLTINPIGTQRMDLSLILRKFSIIISHSDITEEELIKRINDWSKFKDKIALEDVDALPIELYAAAKKYQYEISSYILNLATQYLQSLSQEQWAEYFNDRDSFQVKLIQIHHTEKIQPFFDAFKLTMKNYANGDSNICIDKGTVDILISISEDLKHEIKKLFLDIRDIYFTNLITKEKFLYFGDWMFKYSNLDQKAGCLEKILPSEIIDDDNVLGMLNIHKDVIKGMKEKSNDPSEFTDKLKAMALGNRRNNENLKELCDFLSINLEANEPK